MAKVLVNHLRVRTGPSVNTPEVAYYDAGRIINSVLGTVENEGRTWLKYRGGSGNERFICLRDINWNLYIDIGEHKPTQIYRITCYCSACNSPKGSTQTASGIPAIVGITVAVHPSKYQKNKVIFIEGIGEIKIQDKHGNTPDVIDVYVDNCSQCNCRRNTFSGRRCKISGM